VEKVERQIVPVGADARSNARVCQTNGSAGIAALRACSACAGDYEDPEPTAWPGDEKAEDAREDAEDTAEDEFPAKKQ
jgi:hypothetical protein